MNTDLQSHIELLFFIDAIFSYVALCNPLTPSSHKVTLFKCLMHKTLFKMTLQGKKNFFHMRTKYLRVHDNHLNT